MRQIDHDRIRTSVDRAYHKLVKVASVYTHEFFNDEDEGEDREIWWERVQDDPAYNSVNDPDLWYLQIEDHKPEIIKFLRVLSTIPLWYLGFLFKDYEKNK